MRHNPVTKRLINKIGLNNEFVFACPANKSNLIYQTLSWICLYANVSAFK